MNYKIFSSEFTPTLSVVSSPLAPSLAHAAGDSQRSGDGGEERDGYLQDSFPSLAFHRFLLLILVVNTLFNCSRFPERFHSLRLLDF